jgi:hypothetical protein
MIVLSVLIVVVVLLASAPAWWVARKRGTWFGWDYATLFAPFALWFLLAAAGFGAQSLSNIVELMGLVVLIPALHYVRVWLLDRWFKSARANSTAVLVFSIAAAVGLRAFFPLLPE